MAPRAVSFSRAVCRMSMKVRKRACGSMKCDVETAILRERVVSEMSTV